MGAMRRPLVTALLALVLAVALALPAAVVAPGVASAQETTTTSAVPTRDIIPRPGEGRAPDDAGDRGGALQTVLFVGLVVAVAGGGALLVRQSRRARAERGY